MLRIYERRDNGLAPIETMPPTHEADSVIWFDLIDPTAAEDRLVEERLAVSVPTHAEMQEIEPSARLYHEAGAVFMTTTILTNLDGDEPVKTPVTFVVKGRTLVTVRYAESKSFLNFVARAQRGDPTLSSLSGELVMLGLIEAVIDRVSDALERIGDQVDSISREVFRTKVSNATKKTHDLQTLIEQIGRKGDFLTVTQESLVSIGRLIAFHISLDMNGRQLSEESLKRAELIQRDVSSLGEHSKSLSSKVGFLLDATLGLISLEQSQIIKIFSVAAVVLLPPTLVASIYGMNFVHLPELEWLLGYPWALGLMVLSAILPFLFFKRKGWL